MILPANATIRGGGTDQQWITSVGIRQMSPNRHPGGSARRSDPQARSGACTTSAMPRSLGVVQRTAAKRCESRRKYRAGVQQIGVLHRPFAHDRNRFVEHRQNQPVFQIRGRGGVLGVILLRLAVLPAVEAFAALAAEFFLFHELDQDLRNFTLKGARSALGRPAAKHPGRPRR